MSIDATSRIREGREAEFWLDSRKVHVFDPQTGDNLTRDAEAGARLTQMATEDRVEQVEHAQSSAQTVSGGGAGFGQGTGSGGAHGAHRAGATGAA